MEVILLEDVNKLGDMGEIVSVKPGYARNYLIPQGLALRASTGNLAQLKHQQQMVEARRIRQRNEALGIQGKLNGVSVTIPKKSGENDKLYGSVTKRDIATALEAQELTINSKKLLMDQPIKELGIYKLTAKLHADVTADIRVWVVAI